MKLYGFGPLTLVFVAFSCLVGFTLAQQAQPRIVGGTIQRIENSPYIVALFKNDDYSCAGSLLSYSHVITAAKCVVGVAVEDVIVKAGRTNINVVGHQSRRVSQIFYPGAYNDTTRFMDIGALKLRSPFNPAERVGIIPRCSRRMTVGTQMQISGWGSLDESSTTGVPNLQTVTVPIQNWQTCHSQYLKISINITRTSFCAGNGNGDACSLDTGGPGVVNGELCGVISFGRGCNRPNFPGVYTNLNNKRVARFITNVLAK